MEISSGQHRGSTGANDSNDSTNPGFITLGELAESKLPTTPELSRRLCLGSDAQRLVRATYTAKLQPSSSFPSIIEAIITGCNKSNKRNDITGKFTVMNPFVSRYEVEQVLEGSVKNVYRLLLKIREDSRITNFCNVRWETIVDRTYGDWNMVWSIDAESLRLLNYVPKSPEMFCLLE